RPISGGGPCRRAGRTAAAVRQRMEAQREQERQRMEAQREQERQQKERRDQDLLKTKLELEKQESLARREREAKDAEFRDKIRLEEQKRYEEEAIGQRREEAIKSYVAAKLTAYRKVEFVRFDGPRLLSAFRKKRKNQETASFISSP